MNDTNNQKRIKWIIAAVSACVILYLGIKNIGNVASAVSWITDVLSPLLWGLAFSLILNVPMRFFERILWPRVQKSSLVKLRRITAFALSVILILGILIGVIWLVIPEIMQAIGVIGNGAIKLAERLDDHKLTSDLAQRIEKLIGKIEWDQIIRGIQEWLSNTGSTLMDTAINTVTVLVGGIIEFLVSFIFACYILFYKKTLKAQSARFIRVWLPEKFGEGLIHAGTVASTVFRNFVAGQTIEGVIIGSLCMIGMYIFGLPYAPMVGVLVGVTALIPVMGAYIGAFVGGFMILTESPVKALAFIVFIAVLQQIEGNLIYPRVMGARVKLPAIWILASVTVGGALIGPVGMLLGVPIASTAYILLKEATANREQRIAADNSRDLS